MSTWAARRSTITVPRQARGGISLVEVMIALLVLSVMVIGGGVFMFQSSSTILEQGRKRQALDLAHDRLEEIRAVPVMDLTNCVPQNYTGWVGITGGVLKVQSSAFQDQVALNGHTFGIETRVQRLQTYLCLTTTVTYAVFPGNAGKERVTVSTVYLPEIFYFP